MLMKPDVRFAYISLLAALVTLVDGKGGGQPSSSGGGSSGSKGSAGRRPIITKNGGHTECRDPDTNQVVECPSNNKTRIIAGAIVGSVVGLILIGALIWWCRRRRNKGHSATRSLSVPFPSSRERKEYKHLGSEHSPSGLQPGHIPV